MRQSTFRACGKVNCLPHENTYTVGLASGMTDRSEVEGGRELVSLSYEGEEFSVPRELLEDVS